VTAWTYDADGDQLSETGPTGAVTGATYDFLGRQVTSSRSGPRLPRLTRPSCPTESAGPRVAGVHHSGEDSEPRYGWEDWWQCPSRRPSAPVSGPETACYTYDGDDRLASLSDPATGTTLGYFLGHAADQARGQRPGELAPV
jgi:hypothetical protein